MPFTSKCALALGFRRCLASTAISTTGAGDTLLVLLGHARSEFSSEGAQLFPAWNTSSLHVSSSGGHPSLKSWHPPLHTALPFFSRPQWQHTERAFLTTKGLYKPPPSSKNTVFGKVSPSQTMLWPNFALPACLGPKYTLGKASEMAHDVWCTVFSADLHPLGDQSGTPSSPEIPKIAKKCPKTSFLTSFSGRFHLPRPCCHRFLKKKVRKSPPPAGPSFGGGSALFFEIRQ